MWVFGIGGRSVSVIPEPVEYVPVHHPRIHPCRRHLCEKHRPPSLFPAFYVLFVFIPLLEYRVHHNTEIFSTYLSDKETRDAIMERHFYLHPSPFHPPTIFRQPCLYKDPAVSRCRPNNKTITTYIFKTTYIILHMDHFTNICSFFQV
jgi:hypothetical protein